MNHAENHKAIAEKVWADADVQFGDDRYNGDKVYVYSPVNKWFDLLETDSNGLPTQQAKASALDVLVYLRNCHDMRMPALSWAHKAITGAVETPDMCIAIYSAACAVLKLEEL